MQRSAIIWRQSHATSALAAALVAAVPAAAVAGLVMAAMDWLAGRASTMTILAIGAPFLEPGATVTRAWTVAVLVHLGTGLGWGAIWGLLVAFTAHHLPPVAGAIWGLAYGLCLWFVDFVLILPWTDTALAAQTPAHVALPWHLAYGAVLGGLFHFVRLKERARHRLAPSEP